MDRKSLIFLALSFVVLMFYPVVLKQFYPEYGRPPKPETAERVKTLPANKPAEAPMPALAAGEKLTAGDDLSYDTGLLRLSFNPKGGVIRKVSFSRFTNSETRQPLEFFSEEKPGGSLGLLRFEGLGSEPGPYVGEYRIVTEADGRVIATADERGLRVTKIFKFSPDRYGSELTVRFENISSLPLHFRYELAVGTTIPARHSIDGQYLETNFYSSADGKPLLKHIKETKLGKVVHSDGAIEWAAVKDRHFSILIRPAPGAKFSAKVTGLGDHRATTALLSPQMDLGAGQAAEQKFLCYIGPNDLRELTPLGLQAIVNFGKLDAIGKFLVGALEMIQGLCRNYGLAVILLTVLINVFLFPLTRASYQSMKRMQLIQPQLVKLREHHKKNPERLNKEMMELYKKHKVNPFGGCLPMVLQMPVFIALYVAISKYVSLVNARFLWIDDLSTPDRVPLPFHVPFLGNEIHALPLVMVLAMALQQKFTQVKMEGQDPAMEQQQKMMAVMMPVLFGFIFYSMPSGLVLYWLTNTLLMTTYQLRLKRMTLA